MTAFIALPQPWELLNQGDIAQEQAVISSVLNGSMKHPQVLFWRYDKPGIILGCSQQLSACQVRQAESHGLPFLRRGSGGGAVLAGPWMMSVTVFLPNEHQVARGSIIKAFSWLESVWLNTLNQNGIACSGVTNAMIKQSKALSKSHGTDWACYATLSYGELVCPRGNKLLGLAQIRKRSGVVLVSGLNLSPFDWTPLCEVVDENPGSAPVLASHNSYCSELSSLSAQALVAAIIDGFVENLSSDFNVISTHGE